MLGSSTVYTSLHDSATVRLRYFVSEFDMEMRAVYNKGGQNKRRVIQYWDDKRNKV